MTKLMRYLLAVVGGLGVGAVGVSGGATTRAADSDASIEIPVGQYCPIESDPDEKVAQLEAAAEQACDEALRSNTIQDLEEWLFTYDDCGPAACRARIVAALNVFSPEGNSFDPRPDINNYGG